MSEERDDIIVLIDENGEEVEAEHIDTISHNGNEYVILSAKGGCAHTDCDCGCDCEEDSNDSEDAEDLEDSEDSDEIVIFRIEHGEAEGEETFVAVEDEDEQDAVFEIFTQRMEELGYELVSEEDEDDED